MKHKQRQQFSFRGSVPKYPESSSFKLKFAEVYVLSQLPGVCFFNLPVGCSESAISVVSAKELEKLLVNDKITAL